MDSYPLPNGYWLFWKDNEDGGRTYFSNENGLESIIWDTCLTDESTLLAAIVKEKELLNKEQSGIKTYKYSYTCINCNGSGEEFEYQTNIPSGAVCKICMGVGRIRNER